MTRAGRTRKRKRVFRKVKQGGRRTRRRNTRIRRSRRQNRYRTRNHRGGQGSGPKSARPGLKRASGSRNIFNNPNRYNQKFVPVGKVVSISGKINGHIASLEEVKEQLVNSAEGKYPDKQDLIASIDARLNAYRQCRVGNASASAFNACFKPMVDEHDAELSQALGLPEGEYL